MTYPVFRDTLLESILEEMLEKGEITKPVADELRKIVYKKCLIWMVDTICPEGPELADPES